MLQCFLKYGKYFQVLPFKWTDFPSRKHDAPCCFNLEWRCDLIAVEIRGNPSTEVLAAGPGLRAQKLKNLCVARLIANGNVRGTVATAVAQDQRTAHGLRL